MPVFYQVRAEVIDLTCNPPRATDLFWVDTNVWYWFSYTRLNRTSRPPAAYQIKQYPSYIMQAHAAGAGLYHSGLSFSELAHLIEHSEWELFNQSNRPRLNPKEYRHNLPAERAKVALEVELAWGLVKNFSRPLEHKMDEATTDAALTRFQTEQLDGYDLFMLEAILQSGIDQVITDDGDFVTVPGITVFTANQQALTSAGQQGKLLQR